MRTKALLCAAAILAAGAATSMAQSVYSLNVVGYLAPGTGTNTVGIGLTNGFNLIANQLDFTYPATFTNNSLQTVFGTNLPVLTTVYGFDPVAASYGTSQYLGNNNWSGNNNTNIINAQLSPGKGVWVNLGGANGRPTPLSLTLVGNVVEGTNSLPVRTGFQIMSIIPPLSARVQTDMGMNPKPLDTIYLWDAVKKSYDTRQFLGGSSWTGAGQPIPGVGAAFWWKSGANTNWTQGFTVPRP